MLDKKVKLDDLRQSEALKFAASLVTWIFRASLIGLLSGAASALFLWLLDVATSTRVHHPWLLFGLPACGMLIGALYSIYGKSVVAGNNLLLDEIHEPQGPIPFRIGPFVLLGTVLTHLFGGSAGREGTAVQMGGSLADLLARTLKPDALTRRTMIMAGISAGFGSVFGTPVAGAVFGMEVLAVGSVKVDAIVPCLVASLVGDWVCRGFGITHHAYAPPRQLTFKWDLFGYVVLASFAFAAAAVIFIELTHWLSSFGKSRKHSALLKPVLGGVAVVFLTLLVGNQDYNGLGIPLIDRSFIPGQVPLYGFALKILFTAITLGAGFKGGEVTPLFCIGAMLGATFAQLTHQDPALFAALGFVGVFAGAANTPLACILMGIELFGGHLAAPMAVACAIAYLCTGHRSIYSSQRVHASKPGFAIVPNGISIAENRVLFNSRIGESRTSSDPE